MGVWIDLVHRFAGSPAGLPVQVETLHEYAVVAQASDPYVAFSVQTQLNSFANV